MTPNYVANSGSARNAHDAGADIHLFTFHPVAAFETLTPGAREIQKRTRWSAALCRTVAHLAGFAEVEAR